MMSMVILFVEYSNHYWESG